MDAVRKLPPLPRKRAPGKNSAPTNAQVKPNGSANGNGHAEGNAVKVTPAVAARN